MDQGFGLMRVEMIGDNNPPRGRIKRNRALNVSHKILFGPGQAHGGGDNVSCRDLKMGDQRLGAMTDVFKFPAFHQAWRHGPGSMGPRMGLNAGLLIRAHDLDPVFMSLLGVVRPRADRPDVCVKLGRVRRPVMLEPIPRLMRF
jgi:hypothetical protein